MELPFYVERVLDTRAGDAAPALKAEMRAMAREYALQAQPKSGPPRGEVTRSESQAPASYSVFGMDPIGAFSPNIISIHTMNTMMRDGLVSFILDIRAMPIIALFREEPGEAWDVECEGNKELEEVCRQALKRVMQRLVLESQTARAFGFYCAEKVFQLLSYKELGVQEDAIQPEPEGEVAPPEAETTEGQPKKTQAPKVPLDENKLAWVWEKLKGSSPETVYDIQRDEQTDRFEGYVQQVRGEKIPVKAEKAFVFTHRKLFGNLWGQALLSKLYVPWWWLQFVWRAVLRYLDRVGTPVAVCYAPSTGTMKDSQGRKKSALEYALNIAVDVGKSNAAALPSDVDDAGNPLWKLEYLTAEQQAGQMLDVLRELQAWLFRAGDISEKVVGISPEQTGAYAAWRVPYDLFMQAEETDLVEFVRHVNEYLLPQLGLYNAGEDWGYKGRIRLTTKGLDISHLQRTLEMAEKVVQAGHPHMAAFDLKEAWEMAGLPVREDFEQVTGEAAEGGEAITGAQGTEQGEKEEAETDERQSRRGVPSTQLTNDEAILLFAARQLQEEGRITLTVGSWEDVRAQVKVLRRLGFDKSVPIDMVIEDDSGVRQHPQQLTVIEAPKR